MSMKKDPEEMYQEFREMGYTHQQARNLVFEALDWNEKISNLTVKDD